MGFDNAVNHRQPKPCSVVNVLGCEERDEDIVTYLFIDPFARVFHVQDH